MLALQYGTCQCFLVIVKRGDCERTAKLLFPVSASHQEHNAGLWQRGDGRGSGAASAGEARLHHPRHPSVQQQPVPTPGPPGHEGLQKSKRLLFACSVEPKK